MKWSGRHDSNVRPVGPKPTALARLSYAPNLKAREYSAVALQTQPKIDSGSNVWKAAAWRHLFFSKHWNFFWNFFQGLENGFDVDLSFELRPDRFLEIGFDVRADDEDHLAEAGANGIVDEASSLVSHNSTFCLFKRGWKPRLRF